MRSLFGGVVQVTCEVFHADHCNTVRIGLRRCACRLRETRGNFVFQWFMAFPLLCEDGSRLFLVGSLTNDFPVLVVTESLCATSEDGNG